MSDRRPAALLLAAALAVAGCGARQDPPPPPAGEADKAMQEHLARLEEKIDRLERGGPQAGTGTGAMRQGSSLRVASAGSETVLERLRRLESERAGLQARLAEKEQVLAEQRRTAESARSQGRGQEERADYLSRVQESLVATQQTLAERQEEVAGLKAQLAAVELQRLRSEREFCLLAAAVLRLTPDRPAEVGEVQERLREQAKELLRQDAAPGARR